ncbi:MAG TPA: hypothetical protein VJN69_02615 [Candidatus Acidoferrales bacterium]|nr:hypothetical protein [Candidatus Acidoferrales bacterium]
MPIEYYLAAGVAIILLVLLVFALTGKKSKRVVVQRNFGTDELTKQVARAADALEALLVHLENSPLAAVTSVSQQTPPHVMPAAKVEQALTRSTAVAPEAAKPQPPLAPPITEPVLTEPIYPTSEPAPAEPVSTEEEARIEQKPRRVKLSMFGR